MVFVSKLTPIIGMPSEDFLANFATTIGQRIYVPFKPGVPFNQWALVEQCVLLAHEHKHVRQWRESPIKYPSLYLTSPEYRGNIETNAYSVGAEVLGELARNQLTTVPNDYAASVANLIHTAYKCPVPNTATSQIDASLHAVSSVDAKMVVDALGL